MQKHSVGDSHQLTFAILLKTRQILKYFPSIESVPIQIKSYLSQQMALVNGSPICLDDFDHKKAYWRYRQTIRKYLGSKKYGKVDADHLRKVIVSAAYKMSDPADLINVGIEELVKNNVELPAFSTLDRLANHIRTKVHTEIYQKTFHNLGSEQKERLSKLLDVPVNDHFSEFSRLKQHPHTPTLSHIKLWGDRLAWIQDILDAEPIIENISYTKVRQFAAEAKACTIADMRGIRDEAKKFTLLACFLDQAQRETVDALIDMFLRRMKRTENTARGASCYSG